MTTLIKLFTISRKAQSQEIVEHGRIAQGGHRQLVSLLLDSLGAGGGAAPPAPLAGLRSYEGL
jgi:hypothetical protein